MMSLRKMMPSELSDAVQFRLINIILYELGRFMMSDVFNFMFMLTVPDILDVS